MKVILLENINGLGEKGKIVEVKDGYARNYLIPRGLAKLATPSVLKEFEMIEKIKRRKEEKNKARAEEIKRKVEKLSLTFHMKGKEKIYGAVTSHDILQELHKRGFEEIEKGSIKLDEPLKEPGFYEIPVKLHPEVEAIVKVWLVKEENE